MDKGWTMQEVDKMEILQFLELRVWKMLETEKAEAPKRGYIDNVFI